MIRWITEHLGTAAFEDPEVKLSAHCVVDVRDMVDKGGNLPSLAKSKVDQAVSLLQNGNKVVVCCDYGMSRSNAIAVGVVALTESLSFSDAVRRVRSATNEQAIKIEVLGAVRESLADQSVPAFAGRESPRVLVLGGNGFIGRSLLGALPSRENVLAPGRNELDLLSGAIDLDLWIKDHAVDLVVHLATPRIYTTNDSLGQMLVMLKNVIDACHQNKVGLIYLSSWEVYSGYRSNGLLASESLAASPRGTYGNAKHLCDVMLENYRRSADAPVTILRSSPVYGLESDRPRFIFNFLNKAIAGETIYAHRYKNGFPTLDLLHIDDLTEALVSIIDNPPHVDINVGGGIGYSTTDIARMICELTDSQSDIRHRDVHEDSPNIVMDSSRAKRLLNWSPRVDLRTGLLQIIQNRLLDFIRPKRIAS
jgi:UDP-glucuronate decarboxylase